MLIRKFRYEKIIRFFNKEFDEESQLQVLLQQFEEWKNLLLLKDYMNEH